MVKQMVVKVPHVHGYISASMVELMGEMVGVGVWGYEKLWTARYLPGLPVFGTHESSDDWKGPMCLNLQACAWSNVTPFPKLVGDHLL